jgi:hypothetical protein
MPKKLRVSEKYEKTKTGQITITINTGKAKVVTIKDMLFLTVPNLI